MAYDKLRLSVLLALFSGIGLVTAEAAQAQIEVTGGSATFQGGSVYVPDAARMTTPADSRAVLIEGGQPTEITIETPIGNVPGFFRSSTLPTLNSTAGVTTIPMGTTGNVFGTTTFNGFNAQGEPVFFSNIPTNLNFALPVDLVLTNGEIFNEFQTEPLLLTEIGFAQSPSSVGVSGVAVPIVLVQYQPDGTPAEPALGGLVPASAFTLETPGLNYSDNDFDVDLTDGTIFTPSGIDVSFEQPMDAGDGSDPDAGGTIITVIDTVIDFNGNLPGDVGDIDTGSDDGSDDIDSDDIGDDISGDDVGDDIADDSDDIDDNGNISDDTDIEETDDDDEFTIVNRGVVRIIGPRSRVFPGMVGVRVISVNTSVGQSQDNPVLPTIVAVGVFRFTNVVSGVWCDPVMAPAFKYRMTSGSLFTSIADFPEGIDADDRFTVVVGGYELGEFGPGDRVDFRDYEDTLGDLLVDGEGVVSFTVEGIDPAVDASEGDAFPLKLEFNTPRASFEMTALNVEEAVASLLPDEGTTENADQVASVEGITAAETEAQ